MRFPGATVFFPIFATRESIIAIIGDVPALATYIEMVRLDRDALALTTTVAGLAEALGEGVGVGATATAAFTVTIACKVFDWPNLPAGC